MVVCVISVHANTETWSGRITKIGDGRLLGAWAKIEGVDTYPEHYGIILCETFLLRSKLRLEHYLTIILFKKILFTLKIWLLSLVAFVACQQEYAPMHTCTHATPMLT